METDKILALVLGGGRGTRLYPLTKVRSKPAVPVAGKYRLIDIPLSNCINSNILKVYVLTQFNSMSLHRHIRSAYTFDVFRQGGFVEILAAEQTNESSDWYQGTADAVRQSMRHIEGHDADYIVILSGDQLYRMDYREMIRVHKESGADATIASIPVRKEETAGLGIMRVDETGRVHGFLEKPKDDHELKGFEADAGWLERQGVQAGGRDYLASMGIYVFNKSMLVEALKKTSYTDFGKEVFPALIRSKRIHTYVFDGYWEDIGTIRSFFDANLSLAHAAPPFRMFEPGAPIYTNPRFLPSSQITDAKITNSLIADGCTIEAGAVIENVVIGVRCHIGRNAVLRNSIVMGSDYYEEVAADLRAAEVASDLRAAERDLSARRSDATIPLGIGPGCHIENAIIDKNCHIGEGAKILNTKRIVNSAENEFCQIVDGIVVVQKGTVIPPGWEL